MHACTETLPGISLKLIMLCQLKEKIIIFQKKINILVLMQCLIINRYRSVSNVRRSLSSVPGMTECPRGVLAVHSRVHATSTWDPAPDDVPSTSGSAQGALPPISEIRIEFLALSFSLP